MCFIVSIVGLVFTGAPATTAPGVGGWTPYDLYGGERFTVVPSAEVDVVLNLWFHPKPVVALARILYVLQSYLDKYPENQDWL